MISLRIALRYLFSKKSHNAVNRISIISVLGVVVATSAIVCVMSVFNGFKNVAEQHIVSISPEISITPKIGKTIDNADSIVNVVNQVGGVDKTTKIITEQALALYNGYQMPVTLMGVDENFNDVTDFESIVLDDGEFLLNDSVASYATLSVGVASRLGAHPSVCQYLGLYVPRRKGRINPAFPMSAFRADSLFVSGVFATNQVDYDADRIVVPIDVTRRLLDYETETTSIGVGIKSESARNSVIRELHLRLDENYNVLDRVGQHANSFKMIEVEKWITFLLLTFILVISSFNVISTISMLVIEKQDNMATLRALGASGATISRIFAIEGWLISAIGGIIGIIVGVALCLIQQEFGILKLSGDSEMLSVQVYPVAVKAIDLVVIFLLTLVIGWLISLTAGLFTRQRLKSTPPGKTSL